MKCLNTQAKLVIQKLFEAMFNAPYKIDEGYAKINNSTNYMPVVVEQVGNIPGYGPVISIAHYGEQNGDLMADPEMTFTILGTDYYPVSFKNDYLGIYREVFTFQDGQAIAINARLQQALKEFADGWMKTIKVQQGL